MKVAVIGLGNVGTTLAAALSEHRVLLGIEHLRLVKCFPKPWDDPDLSLIARERATLVVAPDDETRHLAVRDVDYVFDCRKEGAVLSDRHFYETLPSVGVCAQGSEIGFGVPFVTGVNDPAIAASRFVQVASCNTHATATLLRLFAGPSLEYLADADFVVVRRSEDIGAQDRLVGASVVARHRDSKWGTHHATEARRIFGTIGVDAPVTSSDITTPSQLLHGIRFRIQSTRPITAETAKGWCEEDRFLSITEKFDSNRIFELGRRYGFQGRIYEHCIVVANNLLSSETTLAGWAFVPQEGNTLLSTLSAFLNFSGARDHVAVALADRLMRKRW